MMKLANECAIAVFSVVSSITRLAAAVIGGDRPDARDEKLLHQALMAKTVEAVAQKGLMTSICRQKNTFPLNN